MKGLTMIPEIQSKHMMVLPIVAPAGSLYREETYGTALLEKVSMVQNNWVEAGTNVELCAQPTIRHNVSNTVTVQPHMWSEVEDYVYDNRHSFAGISFLAQPL